MKHMKEGRQYAFRIYIQYTLQCMWVGTYFTTCPVLYVLLCVAFFNLLIIEHSWNHIHDHNMHLQINQYFAALINTGTV